MPARKIKPNDRSLTGHFLSTKMDEEVYFESNLEKDFYLLCEYNKSVCEYFYQPISIPYRNKHGVMSTYTPDVLVTYWDSRQPLLVEIKYLDDFKAQFKENKEKFRAAIKYCFENGWKFQIITESIRMPMLDNIKFLTKFRKYKMDEGFRSLMVEKMKDLEFFTQYEFINSFAKTDEIKGIALRYFWIMAYYGEIACDLTVPISGKTIFHITI